MSHQDKMDAPEDAITVSTYNVDNIEDSGKWGKIASVFGGNLSCDIILLQEVHGRVAAAFLAKKLEMPYFRYAAYSVAKSGSGLAILSRYPLEDSKLHYFHASRTGYGALAAEVNIRGRSLLVCCLHLDRIAQLRRETQVSGLTALRLLKKEIFSDTIRSRSVDELLGWLAGLGAKRVIVGGDFNSFPLSKAIRKMNRRFDDALWPRTGYFTGTYRELGYPFKPRIDFIFHWPGIKCYEAMVVKKGFSDHYPVVAVFELKG